jgi:hypothetical protein
MPDKYGTFNKHKELPSRREVHPVWRGIGFVMILLIPIISWLASMVLLDVGRKQGWAFLGELSDPIKFPEWAYKVPVIMNVANYITNFPNLKSLLLFFFLVLILLSGVFAVLNAVLYRMFGPPRYTNLDAPAPRVRTKRYTR